MAGWSRCLRRLASLDASTVSFGCKFPTKTFFATFLIETKHQLNTAVNMHNLLKYISSRIMCHGLYMKETNKPILTSNVLLFDDLDVSIGKVAFFSTALKQFPSDVLPNATNDYHTSQQKLNLACMNISLLPWPLGRGCSYGQTDRQTRTVMLTLLSHEFDRHCEWK